MATCNSEDFRDKEVICVVDGRRLGFVAEIEFDVCDGRITAIIVRGECGLLGNRKGNDILIPWDKIQKIGEDIILVSGVEIVCEEKPPRARRHGKM